MALLRALVFGILEQKTGGPRSSRGLFCVHLDYLDHPVSARRLGKIRRRISRNDGHGRFPYQGYRPSGAVSVFAAAGPNQSVTFDQKFSPIVCGPRPAAIRGSARLLATLSL